MDLGSVLEHLLFGRGGCEDEERRGGGSGSGGGVRSLGREQRRCCWWRWIEEGMDSKGAMGGLWLVGIDGLGRGDPEGDLVSGWRRLI